MSIISLFCLSYLANLIEGIILLEIEYPADFTLIDLNSDERYIDLVSFLAFSMKFTSLE